MFDVVSFTSFHLISFIFIVFQILNGSLPDLAISGGVSAAASPGARTKTPKRNLRIAAEHQVMGLRSSQSVDVGENVVSCGGLWSCLLVTNKCPVFVGCLSSLHCINTIK